MEVAFKLHEAGLLAELYMNGDNLQQQQSNALSMAASGAGPWYSYDAKSVLSRWSDKQKCPLWFACAEHGRANRKVQFAGHSVFWLARRTELVSGSLSTVGVCGDCNARA
eukprot:SAG11_NODE_1060_length_6001_cov_2.264317_2_plen_110_part_00